MGLLSRAESSALLAGQIGEPRLARESRTVERLGTHACGYPSLLRVMANRIAGKAHLPLAEAGRAFVAEFTSP
ncbi:hypothetical protein [Paractinoplanes toevensis]|uniref:Uncharacterized protein n=1 Tax=Paractinoplanes toevensis TaxID=571911 RepID=A0A919TF70_9ACTN|nr:hypothetical protein [Actinoplanes toevensis]GIM93014.1 hypothetical protein Ato02nite_048070 [Actinoplanes toevensis]